eukprot:gene10878-22717_t
MRKSLGFCIVMIHIVQSKYIPSLYLKFIVSKTELFELQRQMKGRAIKDNTTSNNCHKFPSNAHDDFFSGLWDNVTSNFTSDHVMVYSPCMTTFALGNALGHYFHQITCAISSNIYIIMDRMTAESPFMPLVKLPRKNTHGKSQTLPEPPELDSYSLAFFESLPTIFGPLESSSHQQQQQQQGISHKVDKDAAVHSLKSHCKCGRFCWEQGDASWSRYIPLIADVMNVALDGYIHANPDLFARGTVLNITNTNDIHSDLCTGVVTAAADNFLPLVPDVAIHYRCGDTVPSDKYGFLPFYAMLNLIPVESRHIYILTDHPDRAVIMGHPFAVHCPGILQALFEYLSHHYPNTTVLVKKGGDPFLDLIRLARANVVICSASTFCLWPAIATNGTAHFPITPLVARIALGPNFKWITSPRIVSRFHVGMHLETMIQVLNGTLSPSSHIQTVAMDIDIIIFLEYIEILRFFALLHSIHADIVEFCVISRILVGIYSVFCVDFPSAVGASVVLLTNFMPNQGEAQEGIIVFRLIDNDSTFTLPAAFPQDVL